MTWESNDELYHFGIKGQKWGVRNYQNEDGTLTSAGKERYKKSSSEKTDLKGTRYFRGKKLDSELREIQRSNYNKMAKESKEFEKARKELEDADRRYSEADKKYSDLSFELKRKSEDNAKKAIIKKYGDVAIREIESYKNTDKKMYKTAKIAAITLLSTNLIAKKVLKAKK